MTDQEKWEMWEKRIADYEASGRNGAQWCRENGVPKSSFAKWKKKIHDAEEKKEGTPETQWVKVAPEETKMTSSITLRMGIVEIEVKAGYDVNHLQQVLRTVMAVC